MDLFNIYLYAYTNTVDQETGIASTVFQRYQTGLTFEQALELVINKQAVDAPQLERAIIVSNFEHGNTGKLVSAQCFSKITRGNFYDKYIPYAIIRASAIYTPSMELEIRWKVPSVGGTGRQRKNNGSTVSS